MYKTVKTSREQNRFTLARQIAIQNKWWWADMTCWYTYSFLEFSQINFGMLFLFGFEVRCFNAYHEILSRIYLKLYGVQLWIWSLWHLWKQKSSYSAGLLQIWNAELRSCVTWRWGSAFSCSLREGQSGVRTQQAGQGPRHPVRAPALLRQAWE